MDNPTQEQIKEFWEWCEAPKEINYCGRELDMVMIRKSGDPPIDLNNLFKYAVPKLERGYLYDYIHFGQDTTEPKVFTVQITYSNKLVGTGDSTDPALALFWAIWEVIHNGL